MLQLKSIMESHIIVPVVIMLSAASDSVGKSANELDQGDDDCGVRFEENGACACSKNIRYSVLMMILLQFVLATVCTTMKN